MIKFKKMALLVVGIMLLVPSVAWANEAEIAEVPQVFAEDDKNLYVLLQDKEVTNASAYDIYSISKDMPMLYSEGFITEKGERVGRTELVYMYTEDEMAFTIEMFDHPNASFGGVADWYKVDAWQGDDYFTAKCDGTVVLLPNQCTGTRYTGHCAVSGLNFSIGWDGIGAGLVSLRESFVRY